ncbi:MAG: MlaD family protein [Brachymonas sp.]|nr:MlaD family protein [Brachymonas sp.]
METRANHVLIGGFTILVISAALAFAVWLGKAGHDSQFQTIDVVFQEAVSGLSRGSTVEFNGIKVGEVSGLSLDEEDPRRVYARVKVDSDAPVRTDTEARLVMTGLTGGSVIRLSSGNIANSAPLEGKDGQVPEIVALPSPLSKLFNDSEGMVYNANELLLQGRSMLSAQNIAHLSNTLKNLEQTSEALSSQRDDIRVALKELAQATAQANKAFTETTQLMRSGQRLIDKDGRDTLLRAQAALVSIDKTMQGLEKSVSENRGRIDRSLEGFSDVGAAVNDLRSTLASVRTITRQLEDQPTTYLLRREHVKEFTP